MSGTGSAAATVDHLVVAASTLDAGVAWCEATLGVTPGPGGQHPLMGTHNRLLKIAGPAFPDSYLEIIAIDPDAVPPGRARWFGLDDAALQARIAGAPQLIHFVARSSMLDMHRWGLITVGCKPGDPVAASRETAQGTLSWQILVRSDGGLDASGALPTLIQWQGTHPTQHMADSGVVLQSLALHGLPARAKDVLRLRGVTVEPGPGPALVARLSTPRGDVMLQAG
jgi:hypothetical protein